LTIFDVLMEQGLQTKLPLYTPHIPYWKRLMDRGLLFVRSMVL
jgi:hypothetical protein